MSSKHQFRLVSSLLDGDEDEQDIPTPPGEDVFSPPPTPVATPRVTVPRGAEGANQTLAELKSHYEKALAQAQRAAATADAKSQAAEIALREAQDSRRNIANQLEGLSEQYAALLHENQEVASNWQRSQDELKRELTDNFRREVARVQGEQEDFCRKIEAAATKEVNSKVEALENKWAEEKAGLLELHNRARAAAELEIKNLSARVQQYEEEAALSKLEPPDDTEERLFKLKKDAFNLCPGTVNRKRGAAAEGHDTIVDWGGLSGITAPKRVHFETSTPAKPINDESTNRATPLNEDSVAQGLNAMATEFRRMKDVRIEKLRGSDTAQGLLFFRGWIKDVRHVIKERDLTDAEAIQLIRDHSAERARHLVDYYLETHPNATSAGLLQDLTNALACGEDIANLKAEFYSRKQGPKEDEDTFAGNLIALARRVLVADESFRPEVDSALKSQFANGLRDPVFQIQTRAALRTFQDAPFPTFKAEVFKLLGVRGSKKNVSTKRAELEDSNCESPPAPKPKKTEKRAREDFDAADQITSMVDAAIQERIDRIIESSVNALSGRFAGGQPGSSSGYGRGQPSAPVPRGQFQGKPQPPKEVPGTDGIFHPGQACHYCKDIGHYKNQCPKLQRRKEGPPPSGPPRRYNPTSLN